MIYLNSFRNGTSLKDMGELSLAFSILEFAKAHDYEDAARQAIDLAIFAHEGQTRANRGVLPRDTYITHPLRNALRLIRYGIRDQDIILAAILHDVVEDGAYSVVVASGWAVEYKREDQDKHLRAISLQFIASEFGSETARLVEAVSNPLRPGIFTQAMKRTLYLEHVTTAIKDPKVALVKFTDWVDNAVGLYHNTGMAPGVAFHLAQKYMPLVSIFDERIQQPDVAMMLHTMGLNQARSHVQKGRVELEKIMKANIPVQGVDR